MTALQVGARARELFDAPDYSGTVLATMSKAIYLVDISDEILWMSQDQLALHRRAVIVPCISKGIRDGMVVKRDGGTLCIGEQTRIEVLNAPVWKPDRIPMSGPTSGDKDLSLGAHRLTALLPSRYTTGNLWLPGDVGIPDQLGRLERTITSRISNFVQASQAMNIVLRCCQGGDIAGVLEGGLSLIGYGPGLTPSGDDFMGALLFTVLHCGAACFPNLALAIRLAERFLNRARLLTNRISFTMLNDLVYGHGPACLHSLVSALFQGDQPERLTIEAARLTRIGHSTGWSMLAGLLAGIEIGAPRSSPLR